MKINATINYKGRAKPMPAKGLPERPAWLDREPRLPIVHEAKEYILALEAENCALREYKAMYQDLCK